MKWKTRRVVGVALLVLSIAVLISVGAYVNPYRQDPLSSNGATFLSTIIGGVSASAGLAATAWVLLRGHKPNALEGAAQDARREIRTRLASLSLGTTSEMPPRFGSRAAELDVSSLARMLLDDAGRVVLIGRPGSGKSYAVTDIADNLSLQDQSQIPLVVPAGHWDPEQSASDWFYSYVQRKLQVTLDTCMDLIATGRIIPIIDGLDELQAQHAPAVNGEEATGHGNRPGLTEQFLTSLLEWYDGGITVPFCVTVRQSAWDAISEELKQDERLSIYNMRPPTQAAVTRFVSEVVLRRHEPNDFVREVLGGLNAANYRTLLQSPWSVAMLARVCQKYQAVGSDSVLRIVRTGRLVAEFVNASLSQIKSGGGILQRPTTVQLNALATYLENNAAHSRAVGGRELSYRDLELHTIWPSVGFILPRFLDLLLCVVLSAPGMVWLAVSVWPLGVVGKVGVGAFSILWTALLVRTSLKAWVRPARFQISRSARPKLVAAQTGAAAVVGAFVGYLFGPAVGLGGFVTSWLVVGLTVGFGQTLATDDQAQLVGPRTTLKYEHWISRTCAYLTLPMLVAAFVHTWGLWGLIGAVAYAGVVGETVASALWRRYLACVCANLLRLRLPPGFVLGLGVDIGLVRPAGLSYQFRHDEVQAYIATLRS